MFAFAFFARKAKAHLWRERRGPSAAESRTAAAASIGALQNKTTRLLTLYYLRRIYILNGILAAASKKPSPQTG